VGTRDRVVLFDIVRVIGVSLVVLAHIFQTLGLPAGDAFGIRGFYYVTIGGLGVTLMLVLSGASLEYAYGGRPRLGAGFMWRRATRIYPTYWLGILVSVLLSGTSALGGRSALTLALDFSGLLVFTGHPWADYLLPMGWFVGVIVAMYALFPAISVLLKRNPRWTLVGLAVVSIVSRVVVGRVLPDARAIDWFPLCRVFEFGIGAWAVLGASRLRRIRMCCAGITGGAARAWSGAANLSFPVFIVHYPLLQPLLHPQDSNTMFHVAGFLAGTTVLAYVVLQADRMLQRHLRPRAARV
jgi:peptidoglycan/LPS O-acetylase OafA/YrhL